MKKAISFALALLMTVTLSAGAFAAVTQYTVTFYTDPSLTTVHDTQTVAKGGHPASPSADPPGYTSNGFRYEFDKWYWTVDGAAMEFSFTDADDRIWSDTTLYAGYIQYIAEGYELVVIHSGGTEFITDTTTPVQQILKSYRGISQVKVQSKDDYTSGDSEIGHSHTMTKFDPVEATCLQPGNSLYYKCDGCGKYFSDGEGTVVIEEDSWIIEPLGHDWGEVQYEWEDNLSHISAYHVCRRDPSHTESETVQTVIRTISATDVETGLDIYTATFVNLDFLTVSRTKALAVVGTYLLGDVDLNQIVDMDDVVAMLRYIILPSVYSIDSYGGSLDFNTDSALNIYDVIRLLQYYLFADLYPIS